MIYVLFLGIELSKKKPRKSFEFVWWDFDFVLKLKEAEE